MEKRNDLLTYRIPSGVPAAGDFRIRVRMEGEEWRELGTYAAKIDMHEVREASVSYFDFQGKVECEVTCLR